MSTVTVAALRSILGVGALHTDATLQDVCDAADEILLPMLAKNAAWATGASISGNVATLNFDRDISTTFAVGQTVTVAGCGTTYNGSRVITGMGYYYLTFALTHADDPAHSIYPYGSILAPTTTDYSLDKSIVQAAQAIAVDIWQARNSAGLGSIGPDGNPMPYRLGASLLGRVRALIAHAVSTRTLAF